MSDFFQSGLHPDADMLNAFAEHVLPRHEQQQMLAHLAICSECRAVVSAATPALDETIHPHADPVRKPWFSGWNLAWPVAVACTAMLLIVLYVRQTASTRSAGSKQTELAESHPPAAPVAQAPQPVISGKPFETDKLADSSRRIAAPAKVGAAYANEREETINASNAPAGRLQVGKAGVAGGVASGAAPLTGGAAGAIGGSGLAPAPPVASPQVAADTIAPSSAAQTAIISNANLAPLEPLSRDFSLRSLKAGAYTPLPSGLPAMSASSMGQVVLALDSGNTLFYSNDKGRQWKAIASQWKGHAVKVNLAGNMEPSPLRGAARGGLQTFSAQNSIEFKAKPSAVSQGSSLTGTVTDMSGASIPNASVAVSDATKQTVQTVKSDVTGHYQIDGLASGSYKIEAAAPGFQRLEQPVTLSTAQQDVANLKLQVGSVSETVSVTAENQAVASYRPLAKKAAASPVPAKPAVLFEITTDTGDHWTSLDGKIWTAK